jgi:hypothetical protein
MKRLALFVAAIAFHAPNQALAVIDRCPSGECGTGGISLWFYAILVGAILIGILHQIIFGDKKEKAEGKAAILVILRLTFLFVGLPVIVFLLFGGREGEGGTAALLSFFAILLFFCFTKRLSEWAMGGDDKEI